MTGRRHYCTYFDSHYLAKGLALYTSLRRHAPDFVLHVLCFDDQAYEYLAAAKLEALHPIKLSELEQWDPALPAVRSSRSLVEYYFTSTALLVLYVMDRVAEADDVTYLDADLYFYSDPAPIFEEIGSGSVGIIGHRFPADQIHRKVWGHYNVGFLFFRRDREGRRCLEWWRERCLEWCHDRVEDGKFADQKYLDQWPTLFGGVVVVENTGAGLAPWNEARYAITTINGQVYAGGEPLVFYHFHGLRVSFWLLSTHGLAEYGSRMTAALMSRIYVPYIRELRRLQRKIRLASGAEIRHSRSNGFLEVARSHERVIIQVGPIALETRLDPVLEPLARLGRMVRNLVSPSSGRSL